MGNSFGGRLLELSIELVRKKPKFLCRCKRVAPTHTHDRRSLLGPGGQLSRTVDDDDDDGGERFPAPRYVAAAASLSRHRGGLSNPPPRDHTRGGVDEAQRRRGQVVENESAFESRVERRGTGTLELSVFRPELRLERYPKGLSDVGGDGRQAVRRPDVGYGSLPVGGRERGSAGCVCRDARSDSGGEWG